MEIKDFKKITEKHAESCQKLIKQNGSCASIICEYCPFYFENTVNGEGCYQYTDHTSETLTENDKKLEINAMKFITIYNEKTVKLDEKATAENLKKESGIKYGLMLNKEEIGLLKDELNNIMENSNMLCKVTIAKYILEKIKRVESLTTFKKGVR